MPPVLHSAPGLGLQPKNKYSGLDINENHVRLSFNPIAAASPDVWKASTLYNLLLTSSII